MVLLSCPLIAQTWPASIPYPTDFPPLPDSAVTFEGDGVSEVFTATYVMIGGNTIIYIWQDEACATAWQYRLHKRLFYKCRGFGIDLDLNEVAGLEALIQESNGNGFLSKSLVLTNFGQLTSTSAGYPVAVEVGQESIAEANVDYDYSISKVYSRSDVQRRPTDDDSTDCHEVFTFEFEYTDVVWSAKRTAKIDLESTVTVTDGDDWPHSDPENPGSSTLQSWTGPSFALSHLLDPNILTTTNAYIHQCNIFDLPYWGMPDWEMP